MNENIHISPDEFRVAEEEAQVVSADAYIHNFTVPYTYEERTFKTLTFDFGKLTGNDDIAIEAELLALGKPVVVAEMSGEYLYRMAARACIELIGADVIKAMPLRDSRQIRNRARSFLLRSGSGATTASGSESNA